MNIIIHNKTGLLIVNRKKQGWRNSKIKPRYKKNRTIQILHILSYLSYQQFSSTIFRFSASSVKLLSNTVSVSLQLLFLSSFFLLKHLHCPLQFFNQLFLILLLLFLLQPLSVQEFDSLFKLHPLTAKVSDHLFKLTLTERIEW
jgi:hypothetical protein